jgi:hypothetical protein
MKNVAAIGVVNSYLKRITYMREKIALAISIGDGEHYCFIHDEAICATLINKTEELIKQSDRHAQDAADERKLRLDIVQEIRRALGIKDDDVDTMTLDKIDELNARSLAPEGSKASVGDAVNAESALKAQCDTFAATITELRTKLIDVERERDSLKMRLQSAETELRESKITAGVHSKRSTDMFFAALVALGFDAIEVPTIDGKVTNLDDDGVKRVCDKLKEVSSSGKTSAFFRKRLENYMGTLLDAQYKYTNDETLCNDIADAITKLRRVERIIR